MLTTTYILAQKGVILSVTVMKSYMCAALEIRGSAIWEAGFQAGQLQDISMVAGQSMSKGSSLLSLPVLWVKVGTPTSSCIALLLASDPSHLLFMEPRYLISLYSVSTCRCSFLSSSNLQESLYPSGALLIPSEACEKPTLQWARRGQENVFTCPPPHPQHTYHRNTQCGEGEQELWSCESQLWTFFPNSKDICKLKLAIVEVLAQWKPSNFTNNVFLPLSFLLFGGLLVNICQHKSGWGVRNRKREPGF